MVKIKSLYQYPVKSLSGNRLNSANIIDTGFQNDRVLMLIDGDGKFVTQRKRPDLVNIRAVISGDILTFAFDGTEIVGSFVTHDDSSVIETRIWNSYVEVQEVAPEIGKWLSLITGEELRVVRMTGSGRTKRLDDDEELSLQLTDGYPIHIINEASVEYLCKKSGCDLNALRFRPNMIISGLEPFQELRAKLITGLDFSLRIIKPTKRCAVINVNPATGIRDQNILRELADLDINAETISFGVYACVIKKGKAFSEEDLSIVFS